MSLFSLLGYWEENRHHCLMLQRDNVTPVFLFVDKIKNTFQQIWAQNFERNQQRNL